MIELAGEGALGILLAQDRVLLGREQFPPFLGRMAHLESLGAARPRAFQAKPAIACRGKRRQRSGAQADLTSRKDVSHPGIILEKKIGTPGKATTQLARTSDHDCVDRRTRWTG